MYIILWPGGLLIFYDLFLIKVGQPAQFFLKVFLLKFLACVTLKVQSYIFMEQRFNGLQQRNNLLTQSLMVSSVQFSSISQSCPTLCDPMNCSMPGLPVHQLYPEFTRIHVHQVSDAIQPSHPLSSPSPPVLNPSQHQSLFQ